MLYMVTFFYWFRLSLQNRSDAVFYIQISLPFFVIPFHIIKFSFNLANLDLLNLYSNLDLNLMRIVKIARPCYKWGC